MAKGKKKEKKQAETKEVTAFQKEIQVLIIVVLAVLCLFSFANMCGIFGRFINALVFGMFGFLGYLLPFGLVGCTIFYIANKENKAVVHKLICGLLMTVVAMAVFQLMTFHFDGSFHIDEIFKNSAAERIGGGVIGGILGSLLACIFGEWGAYVILFALLAVGFMFMTEKLLFHSLKKKSGHAYSKMKERAEIYARDRAEMKEREEELAGLEEWEEKEEKGEKHFRLPFFNFKRETLEAGEEYIDVDDGEGYVPMFADEPAETEEIEEGPLSRITVDFSKDPKEDPDTKEAYEEAEEEDFLRDLIIHRGDQAEESVQEEHVTVAKEEKKEAEKEEIPIHEMELRRKFAPMEEIFADQEAEHLDPVTAMELPPKEQEAFFEDMEAGLMRMAEDFTINKEQQGAGVVMDAIEPQDTPIDMSSVSQMELPLEHPEAQQEKAVVRPKEKPKKKKKKYVFPTKELLTKPEKVSNGMSDETLKANAKKLQDTLESFGVGAKVTNVSCGPSVTRFELQPDQGVKVSKITALADDIKLNMAAEEIRIEAPIPGKAAVGIEVPNETTSMVHLRDLVENQQFKNHKSKIAFAVGKDIGGQVVVTDIAKMPHLLIAGATGSGKSVCINTLIMSILYKASPEDVKLIMIDPKVVELSCYNGIPHLLIPVVTDAKKASGALQWAVQEMTERYRKFAELGVREAHAYNEKIKAVEYADDERYQKMPQIVIIVDELADLMMVASKEVEDAICRLAQLARAAGIHLVIATQRPSVNVITGLIKANVPSRIAFAVSSTVDSRTILDGGGAEKLLGKGDMLFYPAGFPKPVRVQGAFVSDDEVNAVVEFIKTHNDAEDEQSMKEIESKMETAGFGEENVSDRKNDMDDYFAEAGKFIIEKNKASIGMLQRVYKIGFNRAARIMDQLCAAGVVGPEEGTKPRKVIMTMEEFEAYLSQ